MPKYKFYLFICFLLVLTFLPQNIYKNVTPSIRLGYYLGVPIIRDIHPKDLVIFCLNNEVYVKYLQKLHLKMNNQCSNKMPYFIKRIVASQGAVVTINDFGIDVNYMHIANTTPLRHIDNNLLKHVYINNYQLKAGEFIVLGDIPSSYDSRYFGIIRRQDILKIAYEIF
jgi:signal peptidase I